LLPDPEERIVAQLLCYTDTLFKQSFALSAADLTPHFQGTSHWKGFLWLASAQVPAPSTFCLIEV
jgi:hypothetical protein